MLSHAQLVAALDAWGARDVDDRPDKRNSVSGKVIRCAFEGRRAAAVAADADAVTQIGALLDLLDLHLVGDGTYQGSRVVDDEVALLLTQSTMSVSIEVTDAVATLTKAMTHGPRVVTYFVRDATRPDIYEHEPPDFTSDDYYKRWPGLLASVAPGPPELLRRVHRQVGRNDLRAYPMLTGNPWWSLRLEGLELGRFRPGRGWLQVGKVGRTGNSSAARAAWLAASGTDLRLDLAETDDDVRRAADRIAAFLRHWPPPHATGGTGAAKQNEHALESRILRGAVTVTDSAGTPLHLVQGQDEVVNWGSQFPTRWGRVNSNSARYLDALLRDGSTPWAIEMKVKGSGGVGSYYRHALGQAVLYRNFIRTARPLHFWFEEQTLDASACRAAVVVPKLAQRAWAQRLELMCGAFGVELIEVPPEAAELV